MLYSSNHSHKHSFASQTDHTATANVDPFKARAPRGALLPHRGPPLPGWYLPTSDQGCLMWFGRTWRGWAGPKVISRTATSETHFPTIKEREKLSGLNIARFHNIGSNVCVCVYVCASYNLLPRSLKDRYKFLSFPNVQICPPKKFKDWNRLIHLTLI